ncbi:hypothetical protein TNCV_2001551 [Trichonephila clavipes]|nr:hypothetical protein TNCV_2001551 [Trichonephila clavipes]
MRLHERRFAISLNFTCYNPAKDCALSDRLSFRPSKGSSTRGEFASYKPAFLQAARKLAQCTHRTRLKAAFKKALEKVDSAGDFTRHSPAFERFRLETSQVY